MSPDSPRGPAGYNPFSVPDPEHLDDELLGDRISIYHALLARLNPEAPSVLGTREHVAAALAELEAERRRRQSGAASEPAPLVEVPPPSA